MADSKDGSSTAKSQKFCWENEDVESLMDSEIELKAIKPKWRSLRPQHGRELAKENKRKSGKSTDDVELLAIRGKNALRQTS